MWHEPKNTWFVVFSQLLVGPVKVRNELQAYMGALDTAKIAIFTSQEIQSTNQRDTKKATGHHQKSATGTPTGHHQKGTTKQMEHHWNTGRHHVRTIFGMCTASAVQHAVQAISPNRSAQVVRDSYRPPKSKQLDRLASCCFKLHGRDHQREALERKRNPTSSKA